VGSEHKRSREKMTSIRRFRFIATAERVGMEKGRAEGLDKGRETCRHSGGRPARVGEALTRCSTDGSTARCKRATNASQRAERRLAIDRQRIQNRSQLRGNRTARAAGPPGGSALVRPSAEGAAEPGQPRAVAGSLTTFAWSPLPRVNDGCLASAPMGVLLRPPSGFSFEASLQVEKVECPFPPINSASPIARALLYWRSSTRSLSSVTNRRQQCIQLSRGHLRVER